ncbi:DUF4349 domain-containing protein [Microbacterium aurugineum]|uniref:DUF4349 domain-containing protein n=1 Tax=Microbacterium aurugineum TaxID=2851642 RepID=UPI0020BDF8AA|nr:DUF4349 domain-containing protein [Microbacterium aurugineum]MCK8477424.1 DUF4349 domain-containing protein [Microbacterium aurugineum]
MKDQNPHGELPVVSDETIARIEESVFAEIAAERAPVNLAAARARTRRRRWLTGGGVAAAFVIGVLVTPPILGAVGGSTSVTAGGWSMSGDAATDASSSSPDRMVESVPEMLAEGTTDAGGAVDGAVDSDREIIATAQATVQVPSIPKAATTIAALAADHGGYVESTEIGKAAAMDGASEPAPADSAYGWISVRVPSDDLPEVIAALGDVGDVLSSSTSKQDVTSISIDLQARIDSTRASVDRLTELMSQSGSVSELIEAEVALTDRQAQLESYEQQLEALQDQVAMSSLQVQLTRENSPTTADPAGFSDGLLAGWNGLVVSLNALVIAVGFILPWLAIAGVVILIVWLVRRSRRARRASHAATGDRTDAEEA